MSTIIPLGNTTYLSASSTASNVAYAPTTAATTSASTSTRASTITSIGTSSNINTSASATVFVGVYNNAITANNLVNPKNGGAYPGVVAIAPLWYETISGNFGFQNNNTIYVACVATGSVDVFITPVAS